MNDDDYDDWIKSVISVITVIAFGIGIVIGISVGHWLAGVFI